MEDNKNYLPIEVKNTGLIKSPNTSDRVKRALKIAGGVGVGVLGGIIGGASVLIPIPALATTASAIGFATTVYGLSGSVINAAFRRDKDLMFEARKKLDGRYYFFQKVDSLKYARGLTPYEVAGLMTLNTVVGLARYQGVLEHKMAFEENGKNVYKPGFATKTHSINIKNFKVLEELGYISIDEEKPAGSTKLFVEKMTVGNTKGLRESFKKKQKVDLTLIKFKITDKKINLIDFYLAYKTGKYRVPGERRIANVMFNEEHGILRKNNPRGLAVTYDKFGRQIIEYNSKNPGIDAIKNHPYVVSQLGKEDTNDFRDRIFIDEKEQAEANIQNRLMAEKMKSKEGNEQKGPIQGLDDQKIER
jgi:hypothetical protein